MTRLFFNREMAIRWAATTTLFVAALLAAALTPVTPVEAQIAAEHQLEGAWSIDLLGAPGFLTVKTSGFFTRDGSMFIQNVVPSVVPGLLVMNGTGEWVRSGQRQFDLTWIYPVVSTADGSYIGEFKDLARIHYNADGTLEGTSTFKFTLADGTLQFAGSQTVKMTRVRVERMP